jgi:N-acetylglucosaminyl-diphospho-decaprenol L-rhamnosyltransferase
MTPIAVVIVNYNTGEHLRACLSTVLAEAPSELLVVDNASSDGSVEMVQAEFPQVMLQPNKTNLGYGAAANQAIANCRAGYVLLLNADTLLQPGALVALAAYLDEHPRAAVVGPRLVGSDGALQVSCYPFPTPLNTLVDISILGRLVRYVPIFRKRHLRTWPHAHPRVVPWVKGAALAIRREAFDAVGGFDESFFMFTEEVDLCYRLNAVGWEIHFAPVTSIVHVGGASTIQRQPEMGIQVFASILQFYQRHSSRVRLAQVVIIIKGLMLARLVRDTMLLWITRDRKKRAEILVDMEAWRRVLFGPRREWVVRG